MAKWDQEKLVYSTFYRTSFLFSNKQILLNSGTIKVCLQNLLQKSQQRFK